VKTLSTLKTLLEIRFDSLQPRVHLLR
jgi:hypothetical protein